MSNEAPKVVLSCQQVAKTYQEAGRTLTILENFNFTAYAGDQIAIMGKSGAGKTTALQILGGLEKPTAGKVMLAGCELSAVTERTRTQLRNEYFGFIYQFHHLLGEFTALENVAMPLLLRGGAKTIVYQTAKLLLRKVGLADRLYHRPAQLSGGERQRVAVARALVTSPKCVLADEPTGNLDKTTAQHLLQLLFSINKEYQTTFIIVTHDEELAAQMQKRFILTSGCLQEL